MEAEVKKTLTFECQLIISFPEPPGPVKDLKVVSTDYTSISLHWKKSESEEETQAKGYIVEMRHSDVLKWTQCNALPVATFSYTVRGLKPKEMYFLRVRAVNDGGSSDPVELDTCIQAVPPSGESNHTPLCLRNYGLDPERFFYAQKDFYSWTMIFFFL